MVVTTHSAHVIYEKSFEPIRYFKRTGVDGNIHHTDVKDLMTFRGASCATAAARSTAWRRHAWSFGRRTSTALYESGELRISRTTGATCRRV